MNISILREPFLLPDHPTSVIKRKILVGVLFVVVFALGDPFHLDLGPINMSLLGVTFLAIALLLQLSIDQFNRKYAKNMTWTIAHEIAKSLLYLLLLGTIVALIFYVLGWIRFSIQTWLKFQFFTLLYGVIPVTISILHRQNKRLLKQLREGASNDQKIEIVSADKQNFHGTINELLYLKGDENYVIIVEKNNRSHLRMTLKYAQEQLTDQGFIRVHRSYLVNSEAIKTVRSRHLVLMNEEKIPISRSFRSNYVQGLHDLKTS